MPSYSWECTRCNCQFDVFAPISERDVGEDCPDCGSDKVRRKVDMPAIHPDMDDFSSHNSGRGIYNPQMNGYMRHVNDAKEYAKKHNLEAST